MEKINNEETLEEIVYRVVNARQIYVDNLIINIKKEMEQESNNSDN